MMDRFSFLFGVALAELSLTDSLSKAIQANTFYLKHVAVTVTGIKELRSDAQFNNFWREVNRKAAELNIDEPTLP